MNQTPDFARILAEWNPGSPDTITLENVRELWSRLRAVVEASSSPPDLPLGLAIILLSMKHPANQHRIPTAADSVRWIFLRLTDARRLAAVEIKFPVALPLDSFDQTFDRLARLYRTMNKSEQFQLLVHCVGSRYSDALAILFEHPDLRPA